MSGITYDIKKGILSRCKGCRAPIYWVYTPRGKRMPVNADGTPHWQTCPDARKFKAGDLVRRQEREDRQGELPL